MKTEQLLFAPATGWERRAGDLDGIPPQLVLAFGGRFLLEQPGLPAHLRETYPSAHLVFGSTSGEITDTTITEDHVSVTAIVFAKTRVTCVTTTVRTQFDSLAAGRELGQRLRKPGLVHVFVLSDGQLVNGTALARGLTETLPAGVTLTGGLAGDGDRFEKTLVGLDEAPTPGRVVALGFVGAHLQVGCGSSGGWTAFGPVRTVTSVAGNILFQLDGLPALEVYKTQLGGAAAARLPASALSFPLCVTAPGSSSSVMRAVLAVDDTTRSLMFAGDVPLGSQVRFMEGSHANLVAGAAAAAQQARLDPPAELVICVSCVGRRVVLGAQTSDEIAAVRRVLGDAPRLTGFYSYGELAPSGHHTACELHNQTMTITTFRET